ncbi:hypothetical protein ACFWGZ_16355, partial [Lentzea sp. NPDC060358]
SGLTVGRYPDGETVVLCAPLAARPLPAPLDPAATRLPLAAGRHLLAATTPPPRRPPPACRLPPPVPRL